ncbi:hypothetical protein ABPG72_015946 [Tetrahymena utriculariae]
MYDNNGLIRAKENYIVFSFPYQFIGIASQTAVILTKLNPTSAIQISWDISQFSLAQSKYFNSYYYNQYWFYLDSKGNVCVDKLNQPLKLTQNGRNIVEISKYSLPLNTQYTVYYQLMSQNFPFSKQYATFLIDIGQSYPYTLVQGIIPSVAKIVQVNLQDVVYVNIQLHTDFLYRIIFAQFLITLNYNNVQHTITQISNQFFFILEDYFPLPDFTKTVSVNLEYQIYDQVLQQSIPIPSGNQPSVIYVRAPPSPISLKITQTLGPFSSSNYNLYVTVSIRILVVISGEDPEDSNKWIISYFITFALIELFFGIGLCSLMYYAIKKAILKAQTNTALKFMGARLLLLAFSNQQFNSPQLSFIKQNKKLNYFSQFYQLFYV